MPDFRIDPSSINFLAEDDPRYAVLTAGTVAPLRDQSFDGLHPHISSIFEKLRPMDISFHTARFDGPVLIEPRQGWAITSEGRIIRNSLMYPSPASVAPGAEVPDPSIRVPSGIVLRWTDSNYFHFFHEILGSLAELERYVPLDTVSILVPAGQFSSPHFQWALSRSRFLNSLRWHPVPEGAAAVIEQPYFCRPRAFDPRNFETVRRWLGFHGSGESAAPFRRLFVVRTRPSGRCVANSLELGAIAESRFGFEMIEPKFLSMEEQIRCFSEARLIAGIHGAGLTNMLFSAPGALRVLEIFPYGDIPYHYFLLARLLGHGYRGMVGSVELAGLFTVSAQEFASELEQLTGP